MVRRMAEDFVVGLAEVSVAALVGVKASGVGLAEDSVVVLVVVVKASVVVPVAVVLVEASVAARAAAAEVSEVDPAEGLREAVEVVTGEVTEVAAADLIRARCSADSIPMAMACSIQMNSKARLRS